MGDTIQTRLEIVTTGASQAVSELNSVANASKQLGGSLTDSAGGFSHAEHALARLGGAGREPMMMLHGLQEVLSATGESWAALGTSLAITGGLAAAAVGISLIMKAFEEEGKKISEVNKLIDDYNSKITEAGERGENHGAGGDTHGFWSHMALGFRMMMPGNQSAWDEKNQWDKDKDTASRFGAIGHRYNSFKEYSKETADMTPAELISKKAVAGDITLPAKNAIAAWDALFEEAEKEIKSAKEDNKLKQFWAGIQEKADQEKATGQSGPASDFLKTANQAALGVGAKNQFEAFKENWKNTTGEILKIQKEASEGDFTGKHNVAAELFMERLMTKKASGEDFGDVGAQYRRAQADVDRENRKNEFAYKKDERNREKEMEFLSHPKFSSGQDVEGSVGAYHTIAMAQGEAEGKEELKRLQQEQLNAQLNMASALQEMNRKSLGIVTIDN